MPDNMDNRQVIELSMQLQQLQQDMAALQQEFQQYKEQSVKKLDEAIDYYDNILALMPGHVYWLDANNIYVGCNNLQARDANLTSRKEIVGKKNSELPWREQAEELDNINLKVMNSGIAEAKVEHATMANGYRIFFSQKVPLYNKNHHIMGLVGISIDITDLKKTEAELVQAKEKAEAANRAKDEFIQNMSHDIRTPLTGIIGMSSILEQTVEQPIEKEYAHMVNMSGQQLLMLLNSVLDIIATGSTEENQVRHQPFDLYHLVQTLYELELPTVIFKKLTFAIQIDNPIPRFIISDEVKLHRILLNLIGNAIKFTPEGGKITIILKSKAINDTLTQLECHIADTGIGIVKDDQIKIFDRFYRSNPTYKGMYAGHGVGLHIVQKYTTLLDGNVQVSSEPGLETVFVVTLPVLNDATKKETFSTFSLNQSATAISHTSPAGHDASSAATNLAWPLLLIIEDNAIALRMAQLICHQASCRFMSATSGEMALELLQSHDFDLIITDIGLPAMSGSDLAGIIRAHEQKAHKLPTPIIGITAHALELAEEACFKAGMNKIVVKPITLTLLQQLLSEYLKHPVLKKSLILPDNLSIDEQALFQLDAYPILDEASGLSYLGKLDVLHELLTILINDEIPNDLIALKKAYAKKNWQALENIAHKIKSSAVYCGALRLKQACHHLETYHRAGNQQLLEALYQQLCEVIDKTTDFIAQWLDK